MAKTPSDAPELRVFKGYADPRNLFTHRLSTKIDSSSVMACNLETRLSYTVYFNRNDECLNCGAKGKDLFRSPCSNPGKHERPISWDWCETEPSYEELKAENTELQAKLTEIREKLCDDVGKLSGDVDQLFNDIKEI